MSLTDVVKLTGQPLIKNKIIGPVLLAVFENLIRQIVGFCDKNGYDLSGMEVFDHDTKEWHN